MPDRSPQTLWETALGQLELQVTRPNFETWLRNTAGLRLEGDLLVVGVPSDFCAEWLRSRMSAHISRSVSQLLNTTVSVAFEVLGAQPAVASAAAAASEQAPTHTPQAPELNARFTFDLFTVVKSNRLAYRSARRAASGDGGYNPLVIYGAPGLGKTHLLHAIGHAFVTSGRHVVCLTGEAFVDRYANSVRTKQPHTFRELFRDCGLLLLDDLSFLSTRSASQEQFFHIFNTLSAAGCQVALTIDTAPDSLSGLTGRLRSRLQAGLTIELRAPTRDEQREILQAKAAGLSQRLATPVIQLIADQPHENIRELEGSLNRVSAFADLSGEPLSVETARAALHPLRPTRRPPSAEDILTAVCEHFHISRDQIVGRSRARDITYARHIAMYLLRLHGSQPLAEIGRHLGGRDHSTVLHACHRINQERTALPETRSDIERLEAAL